MKQTYTHLLMKQTYTHFESSGIIEVESDRTWSWLIDYVTDEIQKDIDQFDLRGFHCEVVEDTKGVEHYSWVAEGVVMTDG